MDNTPLAQGYRNDIATGWIQERAIRCFANFVRNYDGVVDDPDFFSVVAESRFGHESEFLPVLLRHAPVTALAEADIIDMSTERLPPVETFASDARVSDVPKPLRRLRRRAVAIHDLSDAVPCVLRRMWNRPPLRKACRAVLEEIAGTLLSDVRRESAKAAADSMETRFGNIVSFLNLDPVAADVLAFTAVREFTVFRDFPVHCRALSQRISFHAMASDRPEGAVAGALRANAPLRRFEVLDDDGDLCAGPFRDFLENGSETLLEGRFYKRATVDDALPLSFHGDLAARHAPILKTLLASATPAHAPAILFYGPPGTEKTEFAKHLAREAGARLTVLGGSDLLSKYVGETEARIRAAFSRARSERSILFLDEADGLLMERAAAERSWELSQVNELLRAIENFEGVFIAATNFMDRLDPAVLRRFSLKLRFGYLTPAAKRTLFGRMFKVGLSPADAARLDAIPNLAPGDFRTVRQSLHYLSDTPPSPDLILSALARESSLKRDAPSSRPPIGFAP